MRVRQPRQIREAAWAAILVLAFMAAVSHAQDFRGSMAGAVMDSSGGRIQSAEVRLQATESSLERQTRSDGRGEFRFTDLLPGAYTVTVRAKGFADASSTVSVTVGVDGAASLQLETQSKLAKLLTITAVPDARFRRWMPMVTG